MILTIYLMGYVQVFLLWNFEESEKLNREQEEFKRRENA